MTVVYDKQANLADPREINLCFYTNPTSLAIVGYRTTVDPAIVSEKLNTGSPPAAIQIAEIDGNILGAWAEDYGTGTDDAKVWHKADMPADGPAPFIVYDRTPLGDDEDNADDDHKTHVTDITGEKGCVMHLMFAGESTPEGYSAGDNYWDGQFPVGAQAGLTANSDENSPTMTLVSCSGPLGAPACARFNYLGVSPEPTHTHDIGSIAAANTNNVPEYKSVKFIRSDKINAHIPKDAIIIFDTSVPSGFTRYSDQDGKYVRGGTTAGATGGNANRRFAVSGTTSTATPTIQADWVEETELYAFTGSHAHTISANSGYINNDPPYITVVLGKANDSINYIPAGAIIMFDETPPAIDWEVLSWGGKLLIGGASYGATGGNATNTPANLTVNTATAAAYAGHESASGSRVLEGTPHYHQMELSFGAVSTYPKCRPVIFAKAKHDITEDGPEACVIDYSYSLNTGDAVYALNSASGRHLGIKSAGNAVGELVCCFAKSGSGSNDYVYLGVSSDGGKTWSLERIDSTDSNQVMADMVIDKNNIVHVVWAEMMASDADKRQIKYKQRSAAGVWGSVETVSTAGNPYYQVDPCVQVKNDGVTIGVAWIGYGWGDNAAGLDVAYRERSSGGSWGSEERITTYATGTLNHRGTALDFDTDDYPHIVANYGNQSVWNNSNVYYWYKTAAGWQAREQVNNDAADNNLCPTNGNLVIDGDNNIHIAYSLADASGPQDILYKKKARGGSWPAKETALARGATPTRMRMAPQIQLHADGTITCTFTTKFTADNYHEVGYIMRDPSTGWGAATTLKGNAGRNYMYLQTLWSRMPLKDGIFQSLSNQYIVMIYYSGPSGYGSIGDLYFEALPTTVIGDIFGDVNAASYKTKRRGAICLSKINGPLASPALIS